MLHAKSLNLMLVLLALLAVSCGKKEETPAISGSLDGNWGMVERRGVIGRSVTISRPPGKGAPLSKEDLALSFNGNDVTVIKARKADGKRTMTRQGNTLTLKATGKIDETYEIVALSNDQLILRSHGVLETIFKRLTQDEFDRRKD